MSRAMGAVSGWRRFWFRLAVHIDAAQVTHGVGGSMWAKKPGAARSRPWPSTAGASDSRALSPPLPDSGRSSGRSAKPSLVKSVNSASTDHWRPSSFGRKADASMRRRPYAALGSTPRQTSQWRTRGFSRHPNGVDHRRIGRLRTVQGPARTGRQRCE